MSCVFEFWRMAFWTVNQCLIYSVLYYLCSFSFRELLCDTSSILFSKFRIYMWVTGCVLRFWSNSTRDCNIIPSFASLVMQSGLHGGSWRILEQKWEFLKRCHAILEEAEISFDSRSSEIAAGFSLNNCSREMLRMANKKCTRCSLYRNSTKIVTNQLIAELRLRATLTCLFLERSYKSFK